MYNDLGKTNKEKIQTHWPLITFFFLHSFPLCSAILFSLCPLTQKDVYLLLSTIHLAIFSEFWSWASQLEETESKICKIELTKTGPFYPTT